MNLPDYVTKIEGHGVLNIHFKECRARLEVTEGERLFEAVLLGQDAARAEASGGHHRAHLGEVP